jgi:hypothetical protein
MILFFLILINFILYDVDLSIIIDNFATKPVDYGKKR